MDEATVTGTVDENGILVFQDTKLEITNISNALDSVSFDAPSLKFELLDIPEVKGTPIRETVTITVKMLQIREQLLMGGISIQSVI